ncbi:MAG: four helix bundle protein [Bryobacterales bacterium]|nr:four helix bundle protein [Acidobacteriota bacterium]MCB9385125.1 four helix bundle protein [Bryobacterales bacterium]
MALRSFEELDAWQSAHQLTLAVYRATANFPQHELFGLTAQLRRAAASVEANLAEGFGRAGAKEFLRFTRIADGSLQETKCFLLLARDLGYLEPAHDDALRTRADKAGALLGGFQRHLTRRMQQDAAD